MVLPLETARFDCSIASFLVPTDFQNRPFILSKCSPVSDVLITSRQPSFRWSGPFDSQVNSVTEMLIVPSFSESGKHVLESTARAVV